MMLNVYLADLAEYNSGFLHGEWFKVDHYSDIDDLMADVKKMLDRGTENERERYKARGLDPNEVYQHEEFAIHDYECAFMEIGEYESLEYLINIAEAVDEYGEKLLAWLEITSDPIDFDDLESVMDSCTLIDADDETKLGLYVFYELYDNPTKDLMIDGCLIENYIDFEGIGRSYETNNSGGFTDYGFLDCYK